jgi:integrase
VIGQDIEETTDGRFVIAQGVAPEHTRAAGLPRIRLHDVRHSYATAALAAGVPPKVISQRLGHATIAITMDTYSHVIPSLDEQAAETVARLILGDGAATADSSANKPLATSPSTD